jgi:hypothetical protein
MPANIAGMRAVRGFLRVLMAATVWSRRSRLQANTAETNCIKRHLPGRTSRLRFDPGGPDPWHMIVGAHIDMGVNPYNKNFPLPALAYKAPPGTKEV